MRHLRLAVIALALFAVAGTTLAGAATHIPAAPKNVRAFLLRPDETTTHVFSRTPAFAWSPVSGARCYQVEVGTSKTFTENSLIWSNVPYVAGHHTSCPTVPAMSIDTALPWFTGVPYALYVHVRAVTAARRDQVELGVRVQRPLDGRPEADGQPARSRAVDAHRRRDRIPGLVPGHGHAARDDEHQRRRRARVLHVPHRPVVDAAVHWRVRAVRQVFGQIPNGLPAVSYGPWSPVYTSTNPPVSNAAS